MKSTTMGGPPTVKSLMVPPTPGSRVPVEYVTLVLVAVLMQPVPPPTGRVKSMPVAETTTPPPEQFATDNVPETAADAAVREKRNAAIAAAPLEIPKGCISSSAEDYGTEL